MPGWDGCFRKWLQGRPFHGDDSEQAPKCRRVSKPSGGSGDFPPRARGQQVPAAVRRASSRPRSEPLARSAGVSAGGGEDPRRRWEEIRGLFWTFLIGMTVLLTITVQVCLPFALVI